MPSRAPFPLMVAFDGSRPALNALAAGLAFPWPAGASAHVVVARGSPRASGRSAHARIAHDRAVLRTADQACRKLARRWPAADVRLVDATPVAGILREARRRRARAIVLGWRGHGVFRRLLMGSVSRGVIRHSTCPVLVVRHRPREIRRLLVGLDGSAHARHAVDFIARLAPPRGGRVILVRVVEPVPPLTSGFMPADVRRVLRNEAAQRHGRQRRLAERYLARVARRLQRAGWKVRTVVCTGAPLAELLASADAESADVLVVGARGTSGLRRLLLGSVAEGALNQSPIGVLVVR